jgi:hypothetical protein
MVRVSLGCALINIAGTIAASSAAAGQYFHSTQRPSCHVISVGVGGQAMCSGSCPGANVTCELLDPTDPSTGCVCKAAPAPLPPAPPSWVRWLHRFGHDVWQYPPWVAAQIASCKCTFAMDGASGSTTASCTDGGRQVDWRKAMSTAAGAGGAPAPAALTYCLAKAWLVDHMPEWDKHFLPPSVAVNGASMFDDNIAFALMADNASRWSSGLPLAKKLAFILPYATFHESRANWRPLMFAKFFQFVADAQNTSQAMSLVLHHVQQWQNSSIAGAAASAGAASDSPRAATSQQQQRSQNHTAAAAAAAAPPPAQYKLRWSSSTSPPVISPWDFTACKCWLPPRIVCVSYGAAFAADGYGSCTAFASLHVYAARAVGIPARVVGAPCWNSNEFVGLARDNPNVSQCWHGGVGNTTGGAFLDNHNWLEFWDDVQQRWVTSNDPGAGVGNMCGGAVGSAHGCGWSNVSGCRDANSHLSLAMRDHEIVSVTWEHPADDGSNESGPIIDVGRWKLSSGEAISPLVWSSSLASPLGQPLARSQLRVINRTLAYRCQE